jgi:hypothetical protein
MQDVHGIFKLGDIQNPPLAQHMNSNLSYSGANNIYRLPVRWFQSALSRVQLKSTLPSSLGWKIAEIIETRTNEA